MESNPESAPAASSGASGESGVEQRLRQEQQIIWADRELVRNQRDAAEERFVRAREEASELEQEMADLRSELMFVKRRRDEALARAVYRKGEMVLLVLGGVVIGVILHWVLA